MSRSEDRPEEEARTEPEVEPANGNNDADHDETPNGTNLPDNLPRDLEEALASAEVPEELRLRVLNAISMSKSYSGPLPPAEMFERYESVMPGSGERIIAMAEKEQKLRGNTENGAIANDKLRVYGSITVSLALIVAAVIAAYLGEAFLSGVLGLGGIIGGIIRQVIGWVRE